MATRDLIPATVQTESFKTWAETVSDEADGSSVPDPSAEPDGRTLRTSGGVLGYDYLPLRLEWLDESDRFYDSGLAITDRTDSNGTIGFTSLPVPFSDVIIDTFATYVVTAGSADGVVRMGLYSDDGGKPGILLVDGGTAATDTSGYKNIAIDDFHVSKPTNFWLAVHRTGTDAAVMPMTSHTTRPQTVMGVVSPYYSGYSQRFNTTVMNAGYSVSESTDGPLPATFPGGGWTRYVNLGGIGLRRA